MSYCTKKITTYGTTVDLLEQIAQTFENNGVIPLTVTRTNIPYSKSVSTTPTVTCDYDNIRIIIQMNGSMTNSTSLLLVTIYQKNPNTDEYINVFNQSTSYLYYSDNSYNNNASNINAIRKCSFQFVKNNEGVVLAGIGYDNANGFFILTDVDTATNPTRFYIYYYNNGNYFGMMDNSLNTAYAVSSYNKPINTFDDNKILLQYQIPVNYVNSSYDVRYTTSLKNTSSMVADNTVTGNIYTLNTKSGKQKYLYICKTISMECGEQVT